MRIKPTFDNVVLVQRDSSKSKNKIVLPNHLEEERRGWFVVEIGPDVTCCKAGEQVAFNSTTNAAKMAMDDGKEYVVMPQKDIVGVLTK